jgi:hypothetical protein
VGKPGLVKEPPGEHARRIVVDELAGEQEEESGDDRGVETRAKCLAQPSARRVRREAAC